MKIILAYLFIINAVAFVLMLVDKYKAKRGLWRIPEATLMLSVALGGSIGALLGMYAVRHKTQHPKFTVGIPVILALQIIVTVVILVKFVL